MSRPLKLATVWGVLGVGVLALATACAREPENAGVGAVEQQSSAAAIAPANLPHMVVHKSPTCGCCGLWVEHMQQAGFHVEVIETDNLVPVKEHLGVPYGKGSCHTHLGHSLVNRDMPATLAQLAPPGHRYDSQLGWVTSLKAHWGDAEIDGFEAENAHSRFRPAHEPVDSGEYDAIVLTEMVEIRDAIRYFDSAAYLALWAEKAIAARADVRLYLYETWHRLDDPDDWLERLDRDLDRYWLRQVLGPALQELPQGTRINLIPAGQVLAAFVRVIEAQGGVDNIRDRTDLFARGSSRAMPKSRSSLLKPITWSASMVSSPSSCRR